MIPHHTCLFDAAFRLRASMCSVCRLCAPSKQTA